MDVEKFLAKADLALRKRNAPQAIALYRQVLVAAPGHARARAGLLAAFRRKVELKGGPSLLDRAAARSLRAAAAGLKGARQSAALVKTCEAGLEKDPGDTFLAACLADALEALDRPEEALAAWQHRLELDEGDVEALKAAGRLHYDLRQIEEAVRCLDRAHAIDSHDPEVERLRKNLAAEGTLAATRYETAASSRELIRDVDAVRRAERSERLHRSRDELREDIAELVAHVEQAPDDLDAGRRLVRAQLRAGDFEAALTSAEAGLARQPGDEGLLDLAGEVRLARLQARIAQGGEPGEVRRLEQERARLEVQELDRRVPRNPSDTALRLRLARACYRSGDTDRALEQFQVLAADGRVRLEACEGLGACFFRKGLLPLARRQFEQALELAGGVGGDRGKDICYHLGLVCERLGETQNALARFMEIYEVDIHFKDVATKIETLGS